MKCWVGNLPCVLCVGDPEICLSRHDHLCQPSLLVYAPPLFRGLSAVVEHRLHTQHNVLDELPAIHLPYELVVEVLLRTQLLLLARARIDDMDACADALDEAKLPSRSRR